MKIVKAILTAEAKPIADCFAVETMRELVNTSDNVTIEICNSNCLDALRLLRKTGEIGHLTVTFQNGVEEIVNDNGKMKWVFDSITDSTMDLLRQLAE